MSPGRRSVRTAGRRAILLLAAALATPARDARAGASAPATAPDPVTEARESLRLAETRFGVKISSVRTTAAGHVVDLRYRVLDAGKASPLFARGVKPHLFDQASGRMLSVPSFPKTGSLRSGGRPMEGRTYFILFSNQGRAVQCGSRVALLFGDLEVNGLVVE